MQQIRGNIRVFCRVRPARHDSYTSEGTCSYPDEDSIAVSDRDGPVGANGESTGFRGSWFVVRGSWPRCSLRCGRFACASSWVSSIYT